MERRSWSILIYSTPDADSQALLATQLRDLGRLVVQTTRSNVDYFVIVETDGDVAALTVHELVMSVEPLAELVDTRTGSASSHSGATTWARGAAALRAVSALGGALEPADGSR